VSGYRIDFAGVLVCWCACVRSPLSLYVSDVVCGFADADPRRISSATATHEVEMMHLLKMLHVSGVARFRFQKGHKSYWVLT